MNPIKLTPLVRNSARALAASLVLATGAFAANNPFSNFNIFGDSLSDTGNAFMLTGGKYPASPPNAGGRISNGPLWVEYLAETLGMELQPENQYAVAGACSGVGNFSYSAYYSPFFPEMKALEGTGLQWQIQTFLNDSGPHRLDPNALNIVWIGANDIFTTLTFGGEEMTDTVYHAIQNTTEAVATLAKRGARHILVVNLPDLGLTPFGLLQGSAQLSGLTDVYNDYLDEALDSLEAKGIRTIRLDAAGLIREIVANPGDFGLMNATGMAIYNPADADGYLFWDEVHPTTAGHQIVAARAVEELIAFYSPRRGRSNGHGLFKVSGR